MFDICQAKLKKVYLPNKMVLVQSQSGRTVCSKDWLNRWKKTNEISLDRE